ncbi:thioredoxin family protein [Ohtaekwangia koreensis]|uniref:Thioredoxin-like n=1 Tax=Ohtaekwangia koreensis TaxID=688867 RepID=A0A1T5LN95_9BACT|nr:thioredoxin family protein [Ohtaekwangia koreensis]SKC77442.1 Thioredoxin-like [Ohtaekwangia koreensis]
MKTLLTCILLIGASTEWLTDFDTAKNIAVQENKYILLNFSGSDWCAPCIKMKKEVFENESFLTLAEKQLVLVRADFPRSKKNQLSKELTKHNEALAEKYNPSGKFPFTVLMDAHGKVIKQWDGYIFSSQDKFIDDLTKTISAKQ